MTVIFTGVCIVAVLLLLIWRFAPWLMLRILFWQMGQINRQLSQVRNPKDTDGGAS